MFKRIIEIIFWIACIVGIVVLLTFTGSKHKNMLCKSIEIFVVQDESDSMISKSNILDIVYTHDDSIINKAIRSIPLENIQQSINNKNIVKKTNVFTDLDGSVIIKVYQRKPLLRVFSKNQNLYIDKDNQIFESQPGETARVIIANGNIDPIKLNTSGMALLDTLKNDQYRELLAMTEYINSDKLLKAIIDQIYVNEKKEYSLIPKIGNTEIIFGDIKKYKDKLSNLKAFIVQGIAAEGWLKYKSINLKFNDQIVCEKNN